MPQITLHFTDNIKALPKFSDLFSEVHFVLHTITGIKIENCKSKVIKLNNYYIGDGEKNQGFVHLEVKIMEGRLHKIKSETGKSMLKILKNHFNESSKLLNLQITTEIIDIQKNSYYKYQNMNYKNAK